MAAPAEYVAPAGWSRPGRAAATDGLSNRETGAQTFLSPRTVGCHLYKAYPKLGVGSRTELACVLAREDRSA